MTNAADETLDMDVIASLRELGDDDLVRELVGLFVADTPPRLDDLESAAAAQDPKRIESVAHALKSSAANLGAKRLSEICRELEAMGRSADVSTSAEMIVLSRQEYGRVCEALKACLA